MKTYTCDQCGATDRLRGGWVSIDQRNLAGDTGCRTGEFCGTACALLYITQLDVEHQEWMRRLAEQKAQRAIP